MFVIFSSYSAGLQQLPETDHSTAKIIIFNAKKIFPDSHLCDAPLMSCKEMRPLCSVYVNCSLSRAFCTSMYTAHLWRGYKKGSIRRLPVAYNYAMRLLLWGPRLHSGSQQFVSSGVSTRDL